MSWWREGVLYQIYPRSFADSNGDGVGDLRGVTEKLDYLAWLGIDGIWLNPVNPSPNADWGYDVSDYCDVHPELGTLEDLDDLVANAHAHGLRVLLDLVPNHTSDRHPWFVDSRSSGSAPHRDWYVWADPKPDVSPPNDWISVFGGPAWTFDERTGQWYLHNFLREQPDLNWWNEQVRDAFDDILRFWFDRGIAGFRIDVAHGIVKDRELRDNRGQGDLYNMNRPEVHDVHRRWRRIADEYDPPRLLVGETHVREVRQMASYYGNGMDELHLAFNFPFVYAPLEAAAMCEIVEATEALVPPEAWPVWTGSNHDVGRLGTRWAGGDDAKARCALVALLTLRGTAFLYYGDELGLPDTPIPPGQERDHSGRDGCRTPMPWNGEEGAGFTTPGVRPWLPLGGHDGRTVAEQRRDPGSTLSLCRDLIALRRAEPDLRAGAYATVPAPDGLWAWRRGENVLVALNLSDAPAAVEDVRGHVLVGTDRSRDGEPVGGRLTLAAWEGAVVEV